MRDMGIAEGQEQFDLERDAARYRYLRGVFRKELVWASDMSSSTERLILQLSIAYGENRPQHGQIDAAIDTKIMRAK